MEKLFPNEDRIYRITEAARFLGVSRITLWRWVKEKRMPQPRNLGGRVRGWLLSDLRDWVRQQ